MRLTEEQKRKRMETRMRNEWRKRLHWKANSKFFDMQDEQLFAFAENPEGATKIEIEEALNVLNDRLAEVSAGYQLAIDFLEDRITDLEQEEEELVFQLDDLARR
jgi:hypothetical protein